MGTKKMQPRTKTMIQNTAQVFRDYNEYSGKDRNLSDLTEEEKSRLIYVDPEDLIEDGDNAKVYGIVEESDVEGLVASMKEIGFITTLEVYENGDGRYTLISGHRRRKAAIIAGIKKVPCIILDPPASDDEKMIRLLTANLHGRKTDPVIMAATAQMLFDAYAEADRKRRAAEGGAKMSALALTASQMEISEASVSRYRAFYKLDGSLKELARLKNEEDVPLISWTALCDALTLPVQKQQELSSSITEKMDSGTVPTKVWIKNEVMRIKEGAPAERDIKTRKKNLAKILSAEAGALNLICEGKDGYCIRTKKDRELAAASVTELRAVIDRLVKDFDIKTY